MRLVTIYLRDMQLRKEYLLLILFVCSSYLFAQKEASYSIDWYDTPISILVDNDSLGAIDAENLSYENGTPYYTFKLNGDVQSIHFIKEKYESLTNNQQTFYSPTVYDTQATMESNVMYASGSAYTSVKVMPFRLNESTGEIEKLTSFSVEYTSSSTSFALKKSSNSSSSVLATGTWYQLSTNSNGILKIDYNYLSSIGVNVGSINPQHIQIYGNGGGMLPQANSDFRHDDLVENAIYVKGEDDGVFNTDDYILFYAEGPNEIEHQENTKTFEQEINIYSTKNYYYLTIGIENGERVEDESTTTIVGDEQTSFNDYSFFEEDENTLLKSGKEWYGDQFNFYLEQNYSLSTKDRIQDSVAVLEVAVMSTSTSSSFFTVYLNGNVIGTISFSSTATTESYGVKGVDQVKKFYIDGTFLNSGDNTIRLVYNKSGNSAAVGYLNYLSVNYHRELDFSSSSQLLFRSIEAYEGAKEVLKLASADDDVTIWDITNPIEPFNKYVEVSNDTLVFLQEVNELKEYVAFSGTSFSSPVFVTKVENQDLHGITQAPEFLIITHDKFIDQAEQLQEFREENDNMSTLVINVKDIYHEFSSGKQDITAIRDFIRMLYFRSSPTDSLKYVLLLGDGSYDYKDRITDNSNYVPVYESYQSLHNINSFSSDDYFAFMDETEGQWGEGLYYPAKEYGMDVGVGRFPVSTVAEAQVMVNKSIQYVDNYEDMGSWQNRICFVADDGDSNLHLNDAEFHSAKLKQNYPEYNLEKIYLDSYEQVSLPGGDMAPSVNAAIDLAVEKGALIVNYVGHGNGSGWTQEQILSINQINQWSNSQYLPLFITATCEFGRFDLPETKSASEVLCTKSDGGAIAMVTTTRTVYAFSNKNMNNAVYEIIFEELADSTYRKLGDVIKDSKNEPLALSGINNRNFSLLGDPSLQLAIPRKELVITEINGNTDLAIADTLKALSVVTIKGEVHAVSGQLISNYNGELEMTVFDKPLNLTTLGNEDSPTTYETQSNFIYKGKGSIVNGVFEVNFVVPKDITYNLDYGKISLYARSSNTMIDAKGVYENVVIGLTADNILIDDEPPIVELYMDDESFVSGGLTNENTTLLVKLSDDNGINVSNGGIGHEITAILDGNEDDIYILNDFFTTDLDSYTSGSIQFPINRLSEGTHTITVKAWDTYNNSGEETIDFVVAGEDELVIDHVLNFPNPVESSTQFAFDHNREGDDLEVNIQVYSMTGQLIKSITTEITNAPTTVREIYWTAENDFGEKIQKGIYVYRLNVRSLTDNSKDSKVKRLVLLN